MKSKFTFIFLFLCLLMINSGLRAQIVPVIDYAFQLGTELTDYGAQILHDNQGNIYVAGNFQGNVDFELGEATRIIQNRGSHDVAIAKYNSRQELLWVKTFASIGYDEIKALQFTADGSLLVLGFFRNDLYFSDNVTPVIGSGGYTNSFLAKISNEGSLQWVRGMIAPGGTNGEKVYASHLTIDSSQDIYVAGRFSGTLDFDSESSADNLSTLGTHEDLFVAKYSGSGTFISAMSSKAAGNNAATGVVVDKDNNVYVSGYYSDSIDIDLSAGKFMLYSHDRISASSINSFIAKYDPEGGLVWAKGVGGHRQVYVSNMAINSSDEIYVCGSFTDTLAATNGEIMTRLDNTNQYIAKYTTDGHNLWTKTTISGSSVINFYALKFDENSNPIVSGTFLGDLIIPAGDQANTISSKGSVDMFILKCNQEGLLEWIRVIGSVSSEAAKDISLFPGGFYLVGDFRETVNLNPYGSPYRLTSVPRQTGTADPDVFFARYLYCDITYSDIQVSEMCSYTSPGGKVWTRSGTYKDTILNQAGCDSIITINLTIRLQNSIEVISTTCPESSDGFVRIVTAGGTEPYLYEGVGNAVTGTSSMEFNAVKGQYIIKTTNGGNEACSIQDTIVIDGPLYEDICQQYHLSDRALCANEQTEFMPGILMPGFRAVWTRANGNIETIVNPYESAKPLELEFRQVISDFRDTGIYILAITDLRTADETSCTCPEAEVQARITLNGFFTVSDQLVYQMDSAQVSVTESVKNQALRNEYAWYVHPDAVSPIGISVDQESVWLKLPVNDLVTENVYGRNQVEIWVEDRTSEESTLQTVSSFNCNNSFSESANFYKQLLVIEKPVDFVSFDIPVGALGFSSSYRFNAEIYSNSTRNVWNGSAMVLENVPGSKTFSGSSVSGVTSGNVMITVPVNTTLSPGNYWFTISPGAPMSVIACEAARDTMYENSGERIARTGNSEKFGSFTQVTPFRNLVLQYGNFSSCMRVPVRITEYVRSCSPTIPQEIETGEAAGSCGIAGHDSYTYIGSVNDKLMAGIHDQNQDLGQVSAMTTVTSGNLEYDSRLFGSRIITLEASGQAIAKPVVVRLFFTEEEILDLLEQVPGTGADDLVMLSFSTRNDGIIEDGSVIEPQIYTGRGSVSDGIVYTFQFEVSEFESYVLATPRGSVVTFVQDYMDNPSYAMIPNPVDDVLKVTVAERYVGSRLEIISLTGNIVYSSEIKNTYSEYNVTSMLSGVYLVKLTGNEGVETRKVLIK